MVSRFSWFRAPVLLTLFVAVCSTAPAAAKKKEKEPSTQSLKEPAEPPAVAMGDAARLVFHVSPLSGKGLLSQQTREALAAILRLNGGAPVVHLRAFVAGSGDLRRISQLTSEVFSKKGMALPSVSVVQVGALPLEGAQVVIESVSEARKPLNPGGVTFVPLQDSVEHLVARVGSGGALAVTCFVDDAPKAPGMVAALAAKFPGAVLNVVQAQRLVPRPIAACEAVMRGGKTGKYAFTGTQAAFGFEEKDANLAFQRIGKVLTAAGLASADVMETRVYALTRPIADMALKAKSLAGETGTIPVEGVAGSDASFAVDVVAIR